MRQEQLVQRRDGITGLYVHQIFHLFFKLYLVLTVCGSGSMEGKTVSALVFLFLLLTFG